MAGIGEALRTERKRQGRSLADAAAETRIRESYLAAIEADDFDGLGGDVYARGFIRLYGKYLGLPDDELVQLYRTHHEKPERIRDIPGASFEEFEQFSAAPPWLPSQPVIAAVALVALLVLAFFVFRGSGEDDAAVDPNAPGPEAAEVTEDPAAGTGPATTPTVAPTTADGVPLPGQQVTPAPAVDGEEPMTDVSVVVTGIGPVQLTVDIGQPPIVGRNLGAGEAVTVAAQNGVVSFSLSDFGAAEVTVNGELVDAPALAGQAVVITCRTGETRCTAVPS